MTRLSTLALPFVKALPAEAAHTATIKGLKLGIGLPNIRPDQWQTPITLRRSGLSLNNPVGLAAGFDKNGEVHRQMARFGFGFIECGTVTPKPQPGNDKPRVFRLPEDQGVINRLGFNNYGVDSFTRRLARTPSLPSYQLGANVGANKDSSDFIADYETGIAAVWPHCDYITINISSPNTPGLRDLQSDTALQQLLIRCGIAKERAQATSKDKPVFLKIAPDLEDTEIAPIIDSVQNDGQWLSGLIISNTTNERPDTLTNSNRNQKGGLSGQPLFEKSTNVLKIFASEFGGAFDLIGCGGISSGADALTKIKAGAHAVQLYTALIYHGAGLVTRINQDLADRLNAEGFSSVSEAVGVDLA